ncbi:MAG: hypothetical protein GX610_04745 [Rhodococcus sp.]|nr:hypothetical protein [Rhodococcus sp. (in: high G+C Gram-positive bacteria)]
MPLDERADVFCPAKMLPGYGHDGETDDEKVIDAVVMRVPASFGKAPPPKRNPKLDRTRPSIPREIDRVLMLDAPETMQIYNLDEARRYDTRAFRGRRGRADGGRFSPVSPALRRVGLWMTSN